MQLMPVNDIFGGQSSIMSMFGNNKTAFQVSVDFFVTDASAK
jgi:hypothetical protein